jgi:hypothetical protein
MASNLVKKMSPRKSVPRAQTMSAGRKYLSRAPGRRAQIADGRVLKNCLHAE